MKSLLRIPVLLTCAGGFLDTFAWVAYGQVFTNAQTGNIILFGVHSAAGDWAQALRHVPPMLAFFPGIFAAQWLRQRRGPAGEVGAAVTSLGIEIVTLMVIGLLPPATPEMPIVFALAFVASLQSSCFASIGTWSYTSVVTTGNLRTLGAAFFRGIFPNHDPEAARQARAFAIICAAFVTGAMLGGVVTVRVGRAAIACPIALLLLALLACRRDGAVA